MTQPSRRNHQQDQVSVLGRSYPVIGRIHMHGRTYLLLDRLSVGSRNRYLGYEPRGKQGGRPVVVVVLPRSPAAHQHLSVLKRLSAANANLASILDYDSKSDQTTVVLDWVHGPTLGQYMEAMKADQKPRISSVLAFRRVRGLAHGLKVLHDRAQVVHGDIKPDNVVVSSDSGRFVLIDFGSAWKVEQTVLRNPGDGISAVYSAPELQNGASYADFRADHFSLSVILYELLTFEIPYGQLGGKAGGAEVARPRLRPPSELRSDRSRLPTVVGQAIDRFLLRSLALDPDRRYPTPEAWLDEFDSIDLDIRRPQALTPLNDRLTRIVSWLLQRWADKEATQQ